MKRRELEMQAKRKFPRGPARLQGGGGSGTLGCIISILLLLIGGYAAYQFAIPYYEHNNFESRISEMMPYYRNQTQDFIQQAVIDTSKEFGLNLKPEQVKVQVLKLDNRLIIDIQYQKTVELPFYTHTITFKPHLTGSVF